jgi:hypothetical protein
MRSPQVVHRSAHRMPDPLVDMRNQVGQQHTSEPGQELCSDRVSFKVYV